jgi:hypothetical protein
MLESIRIKETNLSVPQLEALLKKVEAQKFEQKKKRIAGITLADPAGPDAGHNVIVLDDSASPPPADWILRAFPISLNEGELGMSIIDVENREKRRLRCYGSVLIDDALTFVALFDPANNNDAATISLTGKMSTFGGPADSGMQQGENLAWIETERDAAAYPGYFLPPQPGLGFGRRLQVGKFYLACRWDYSVTPKRFLAQPTTFCTVTNPKTGKSVQARPIDWGPHDMTGRIADLSPGVATTLGLETDDTCVVTVPTPEQAPPPPPPPPPLPPPPPVLEAVGAGPAGPGRDVVFLTGDYAVRSVRQREAAAERCALTVEFHFNSNGATAKGGEVYYRTGDEASQEVAKRVIANFQALGLPNHGDPLKSATDGEGRAAFINRYRNPAILLEPLFVSNPAQAKWLHAPGNLQRLAEAVAKAILDATQPGDKIGLSIGHLGKDSSPSDRGAPCSLGDMEATHGEAMARAVAKLLAA